ncbi:MAG: hypothetical protein AB1568_00825 [Thermodesulfobacteriota bacterium]
MTATETHLKLEGILYRCPVCDYRDGFHVSFAFEKKEKGRIVLICPNCHGRFRTDWLVVQEREEHASRA